MKFKIGIPSQVSKVLDKIINPLLPYHHKCKLCGGSYYIIPEILPKHPNVYSGGIGSSLDFEREMIEKYNAKVKAFDPTPLAKKTVKKSNLKSLKFHPVGLSKKEGIISFQEPKWDGSYGSSPTGTKKTKHSFKCIALSDIVKKNEKIDILKIDIEGSEYGVLDDILDNSLDISQIALEFHHWFKEIPYKFTFRAVRKLRKAGYVIVSKNMEDYTFVKKSLLRK